MYWWEFDNQAGAEVSERVPDIDNFTAVKNRLQVLECQPNGRAFCKMLGDSREAMGLPFPSEIGTGYSKKELQDFNQKLVDHWKPFDKKNPPTSIELAPGFKEKPDAWIEPSRSAIVQIKAAEIIDSDKFRTGFTLRFPRVEKFRDDKKWYDCMTLPEVEELKKKSGGKLAGGYIELDEEEEPAKKKRKVIVRAVRPTLASQFKAADLSDVKQTSKMLEGKEICVINGPSSCPKQELEKKIVECGGKIVQNPGNETYCVLVEKIVYRVKSMMNANNYDIVKASWLLKCVDAGHYIPWSPSDMIHTSPATQKVFQQDFDDYGDSYSEDTTSERLKDVFSKINMDKEDCINQTKIAEMEEKFFPDESPYGLFRTCNIYLDNNLVIGDKSTHIKNSSLDYLELQLQFFGAQVTHSWSADVSHVMCDKSDLSRMQEFREERRKRQRKFHIVTEDWVRKCMEEGSLVNERQFEPDLS